MSEHAKIDDFVLAMRRWAAKPEAAVPRARVESQLRLCRFGQAHPVRKEIEKLKGDELSHQALFEAFLRGGGPADAMCVRLDGDGPHEQLFEAELQGAGARPNYVVGQWPEGGRWIQYEGMEHKSHLDGDPHQHRLNMDRERMGANQLVPEDLPDATEDEVSLRQEDLVAEATGRLENINVGEADPGDGQRQAARLEEAKLAQSTLAVAPEKALRPQRRRLQDVADRMRREGNAQELRQAAWRPDAMFKAQLEKLESLLGNIESKPLIGPNDGRLSTLKRRSANVSEAVEWMGKARRDGEPWMTLPDEKRMTDRAEAAANKANDVLEKTGDDAPKREKTIHQRNAEAVVSLAESIRKLTLAMMKAFSKGVDRLRQKFA